MKTIIRKTVPLALYITQDKLKESKTLSKNFVYPPAKMNQVYKELLT